MRARCGVGEDQRHILGADVAAIGPISRASPAFDPAGDFQFFVAVTVGSVVATFGQYRDFSKITRRA